MEVFLAQSLKLQENSATIGVKSPHYFRNSNMQFVGARLREAGARRRSESCWKRSHRLNWVMFSKPVIIKSDVTLKAPGDLWHWCSSDAPLIWTDDTEAQDNLLESCPEAKSPNPSLSFCNISAKVLVGQKANTLQRSVRNRTIKDTLKQQCDKQVYQSHTNAACVFNALKRLQASIYLNIKLFTV